MNDPIHIISLGAGVQSSTMSLMAAHGEITPMPMAAIFADTQDEPASVYRWLDWLEKQLPFPVHHVTKGKLSERSCEVGFSKKNNRISFSGIPAFVKTETGEVSLIPRQCTRDFKIDPINKEINRMRHLAGDGKPVQAIQWIGISTDEIYRAKEHRNSPRIVNRFPLMDAGMNRNRCLQWMKSNSFPEPPRSACIYCPYHNAVEWKNLIENEPAEFAKAVAFEVRLQKALSSTQLPGKPFLHRSCVPLDQVDFSTEEERGQLNMFNNECEGMCGV